MDKIPAPDTRLIPEPDVTQNHVVDDENELDSASDVSSSTEGDYEDYPLNERFHNPINYFRGLDDMQLKVLEGSPSLQFLTVIINPTLQIIVLID